MSRQSGSGADLEPAAGWWRERSRADLVIERHRFILGFDPKFLLEKLPVGQKLPQCRRTLSLEVEKSHQPPVGVLLQGLERQLAPGVAFGERIIAIQPISIAQVGEKLDGLQVMVFAPGQLPPFEGAATRQVESLQKVAAVEVRRPDQLTAAGRAARAAVMLVSVRHLDDAFELRNIEPAVTTRIEAHGMPVAYEVGSDRNTQAPSQSHKRHSKACYPEDLMLEGVPSAPREQVPPAAFHVMLKPRGAICNLDCRYCYYLEKERLYPGASFRMKDDLLERYLK